MNLGEKIYELRTEKNLSQGDLADKLDVSRQSVSKWENNTAVPDLDKLIKLCDVFGVSLDELTGREKIDKSATDVTAKESRIAPNKIAGYVLLGTTIISAVILFVTSPPAIYLCIPLVICTIVCFTVKKYTWFWCLWAVYLPIELYMYYGIRSNIMHVAKIMFLTIMIILNICCIKDVPKMSEKKRKSILITSMIIAIASLVIIVFKPFVNQAHNIWWIYCIINVILTVSIGSCVYHTTGFIRDKNKKI